MSNVFLLLSFVAWLGFVLGLMYLFSPWFILILPLFKASIKEGE